MAINSVVYASSRVAAGMSAMFTQDKMERLIDCPSLSSAVKYLNENGFEGGTVDEIFKNAYDCVYSFLEETAPVPKIKEAFLKKNDYLNAKILVKCKYSRREVDPALLMPHGNIECEKLKEYIFADNYSFLPSDMRRALENIDAAFAGGDRTGKTVDCLLTQAMYADILSTVKAYQKIYGVFAAEADMANLSMAYRVKKYALGEGALEKEYISGGTITLSELKKAISSDEDVAKIFGISPYTDIIKYLADEASSSLSLSGYEKLKDNYFINLYKKYKSNISDYMFYFGYIHCRLEEVKNIRIACNYIKVGAAKEEIRKNLRDLYV